MTTSPDVLYREISYLAYHFHWSQQELLDLPHNLRGRYVDEVATINRRLSGEK